MAYLNLKELREKLGLNQAEMAKRMGMGSRAYFEVETNPEKTNERHIMLAERAALDVAIERGDPALAPPAIRKAALSLASLAMSEMESSTAPRRVRTQAEAKLKDERSSEVERIFEETVGVHGLARMFELCYWASEPGFFDIVRRLFQLPEQSRDVCVQAAINHADDTRWPEDVPRSAIETRTARRRGTEN